MLLIFRKLLKIIFNNTYLSYTGLADTDFPLDTFYHGNYDTLEIRDNKNLTKIPTGAFSGVFTSSLIILDNDKLVTIESGFMQGSEIHVEEIYLYYNTILYPNSLR